MSACPQTMKYPQTCAQNLPMQNTGYIRTTPLTTPVQSSEVTRKITLQAFLCGMAVVYGRHLLRRIVGAAEPFRNERSECRNGAKAEPRKAGLLDAFAPEICYLLLL